VSVASIAALAATSDPTALATALPVTPPPPASFSQMIEGGVDTVNTKVLAADSAVRSFILDDSIPVHQVSFALEQARLSLELMLQVRGRLVEGYQQLMNMQM
jgi:flagellar hook-basal body complex protein FliE